MIICIDIDNVINNLAEESIKLYNSRSGKNIQMSDITQYNFFDCLSREDAEGIIKTFQEEELWWVLKPIKGSQECIKQLVKSGHQIYFATATDSCNFDWKVKWIDHYFPFVSTDNIVRIMDKSLLKCDVIVDDCLENLTNCLCDRVCLDYPWNHNEIKDYVYGILRAYNWLDIVKIINKLEKEMVKWEK